MNNPLKTLAAAFAIWCGITVSAMAQSFPMLFDVTGVAANDVLNIRREPSGKARIVGALAPNQKNVEVVTSDKTGKWGMVNVEEGTGWVALRFLRASAANSGTTLARRLNCSGTEPFWSLDARPGQTAAFSTMMGESRTVPAGALRPGNGRIDRFVMSVGTNSVAVISREMCSDGMSDRAYGLRIDLATGASGQLELLSGCCSISP